MCKIPSEEQKMSRNFALSVGLRGKLPFWTGLDEPAQRLIAEYMDVKTLCRTDSAMTGIVERKDGQKTLNGLHSVALNKYPRYSNVDKFRGLRWCMLRRVDVRSFQVEKIVAPNGTMCSREDHFYILCDLGYKDIARFMVTSKSIDVEITSRSCTLLIKACIHGYLDMMRVLVEAGADIDEARDNGATPLFAACLRGHLEVVRVLEDAMDQY